jgi:ABC-type Na+ efflux pump permease subunit
MPGLRAFGGAGALAWRQLTELARTPRALLVPLLGATVWVGTILFAIRESGDPEPAVSAAMVIGVCLMLPVLFSGHVAFDFRRDLDRMDVLRSLPLSPVQVAAGQVLPVALVFMALQYLVVIAAVSVGALQGLWLLGLALVIPPYAWATLAVENGLFLLMPYRVTPGDDQRMQFMGKVMLSMFLKAIVIGILAVAAGAAGWGVLQLTDSYNVAIAVGCAVLALGCVPLTFMVGLAFIGFDIGRDTPA